MIIGQDIRRDDVGRADDNDDDVVDESDGFRVRIEAFFGCPGGDLADRQQIEVIFRARENARLDFDLFLVLVLRSEYSG